MKRAVTNLWRSSVVKPVINAWKSVLRDFHSKSYLSSDVVEISSRLSAIHPKTAIGVSEFKKLVSGSTVFVDKTLLIKDFWEDNHETLLLTFPRRWGKSINLDMMKAFFGIQVDESGNPLLLEEYDSYNIFRGGVINLEFGNPRKLNPLKIAGDEALMKQQGQYPVVHIDFKNTKGNTFEEVLSRLKTELRKTYSSHEYLTKSPHLRSDEHRIFNKYLDFIDHQKLTTDEVAQGLYTLSGLLHKHFGKKLLVLMDEYDAAINHSYIRFDEKESSRIIDLFRNINEATFKSNEHLEKGLITGVFRIAKANLFSGLNNLGEYGILDREFSRYYGFTQEEVDSLSESYKIPSQLAQDIKDWYNGYNIGGIQIYNPWSIVKCLNKFQKNKHISGIDLVKKEILQSYWEESGNIDFVKDLFKVSIIKSKIDLLVEDEPLVFNLKKQISSSDYKVLKQLIELGSNYKIDESACDLLFSYLFSAGYLTTRESGGFKLPNHEISTELQNKLLEYYKQQYNIDLEFFTNVTDQLQKILDSKNEETREQVTSSFKKAFAELLEQFPNFEKIKDSNIEADNTNKVFHGNEDLIHCVMSFIALQLKSISRFGTEVYLGKGIADIIFIDDSNKKGAVIELKYNKSAAVAVNQLESKEYASTLIKKMNTVVIGLNVSDKKSININCQEIPQGGNFSGNGIDMEDNSYDLPYSTWFNKYYSKGIEKILQLRIDDLESELREKIKILPAEYQLSFGNTDINKVIEEIIRLEISENEIVLVPYNIENKHWVSLVFKKNSSGYEVVYSDPQNKPIEPIILMDLAKELGSVKQKLDFKQQIVESQKYNNCGSEVVENFIYYLTNHRISQEQAVLFHSQLIENDLYNMGTKVLGEHDLAVPEV